mmetsp:Transcript_98807/g.318655  ORF Transcript_98807/g.318655 Transcript_98807/m.318655 type:complete len:232 (-) Transcript_98807:1661-2356(-)
MHNSSSGFTLKSPLMERLQCRMSSSAAMLSSWNWLWHKRRRASVQDSCRRRSMEGTLGSSTWVGGSTASTYPPSLGILETASGCNSWPVACTAVAADVPATAVVSSVAPEPLATCGWLGGPSCSECQCNVRLVRLCCSPCTAFLAMFTASRAPSSASSMPRLISSRVSWNQPSSRCSVGSASASAPRCTSTFSSPPSSWCLMMRCITTPRRRSRPSPSLWSASSLSSTRSL